MLYQSWTDRRREVEETNGPVVLRNQPDVLSGRGTRQVAEKEEYYLRCGSLTPSSGLLA